MESSSLLFFFHAGSLVALPWPETSPVAVDGFELKLHLFINFCVRVAGGGRLAGPSSLLPSTTWVPRTELRLPGFVASPFTC